MATRIDVITVSIHNSHCLIFEFKLAARYTSVAALLVLWRKAELISPSLLANIPKCSKECHERFCLDMGEWTESSNESSPESEAPKPNPPKISEA